jgi:type 2 lantibiotic biosynthesis protein LanM
MTTEHSPSAPSPSPEAQRLLEILRPLLDEGRQRLREAARALAGPAAPFDPDTIEPLLFAGLARQLLGLLTRTIVLELHIARLQGLLHGDTPQERFASFVEHLGRPETARALLAEYPALARKARRRINCWIAYSAAFLGHLRADWPLVQRFLPAAGDPGPLVEVEGGVSDTHRGGRHVLVARFASGRRLVYKPRSLAIDAHFQELLLWANERGARPSFRTLGVLDRGDHGWVEFVEQQSCTTREEVQRFYERLGGYVALTHALAGSDLHFENLVAAGEHPVLIDLEVLFHPHPPGWSTRDPAEQALADSVLGTGLLPRREFTEGGADGADISGLGGAPGQLSPAEEFCLEGVGTDEMRLVRRRLELPPGRHRPTLNGAVVDPLDHRTSLEAGFTRTYGLLLEHRADLLAPGGLLDRCAGDEVRFVARPTRTYAILLQQSSHPDRLRDENEQERLLDRLHAGVAHHPALACILPYERAELTDGDVPLFTTRPDSLSLWSSIGERMPDFFEGRGLDRVRRRLETMGDADLTLQLSALHAALTILAVATTSSQKAEGGTPKAVASLPSGLDYLDAACAVGDRLDVLAWRAGEEVGWLGLKPVSEGRWAIAPLGPDLHDGLPGVALFLAQLGASTGEARYTSLARAALVGLRHRLKKTDHPLRSIGAFEGWGGVIYTLARLAALWNEPALWAEAAALVDRLTPLLIEDDELDVIGGAAGCLLVLLRLHQSLLSPHILDAAILCGEHLLARAVPQPVGVAWKTRLPASAPLTGLSHGTAGIAWALAELAAATGEDRFLHTAREALRYERSCFDPAEGIWPDFRLRSGVDTQNRRFEVAWCHGAPGIGLTRLQLLRLVDDPPMHREIRTALTTTCARGFGFNHSLCHGDLGNAEVVLEAGRILGKPGWLNTARRAAAQVLEDIRVGSWVCATPRGSESPGLMTGLAGIGYAFLRLADPDRVPSVLSLKLDSRLSVVGRR